MAKSRPFPWAIAGIALAVLLYGFFLLILFFPGIFDPVYRISGEVHGWPVSQVDARYGPVEFTDQNMGIYGHWDRYYLVEPSDNEDDSGYFLAVRLDENSIVIDALIIPIGD